MTLRPRFAQAPLAWQILALMIGGLIAGQAVTLLLTLVFPPTPPAQYRLEDIAATLRGTNPEGERGRALERRRSAGPPETDGAGWVSSEVGRRDLARMLQVPERDVILAYYLPPPIAGAAMLRPPPRGESGPRAQGRPGFQFLHTMPGPRGPMPGGPISGAPGGGPMLGTRPGGGQVRAPGGLGPARATAPRGGIERPAPRPGLPPLAWQEAGRSPSARRYAAELWGDPAQAHRASPQSVYGPTIDGAARARPADPHTPAPSTAQPSAAIISVPTVSLAPSPSLTEAEPTTGAGMTDRAGTVPAPTARAQSPPPSARAPALPPAQPPVRERGLFGLAPAPFVIGDFIAAWRTPGGQWLVVQPTPEPFPNSWQRRVLLWFALALALVAPLAWLFARRVTRPIDRFALAAEQLGRDPTAPVMALAGPAEIGRAAAAFNLMQGRLRRFVEDRTAMIGAISHDMRTPLTRMRFRLEEVPDAVREGMLEEVIEMEDMVTSVLAFLRSASDPALRETADLRSILENVVDGTTLVGGEVALEPGERAVVEVDAIGIRRVLDNLIDNALKYGERARIRLSTEGGEAVAAISDEGPGLPEAELSRVFQPFYRGDVARASGKQGIGLGLAACRSIARAHGGDVELVNTGEGLEARLRLPLAEMS